MLSKNQKILRSLICRNNDHESIPQTIPPEKIKMFYRELCWAGSSPCFKAIVDMAAGKQEPLDEQISQWSRACKWYNGTWNPDQ